MNAERHITPLERKTSSAFDFDVYVQTRHRTTLAMSSAMAMTRATAYGLVAFPLGVVAHVVAVCALPWELLATLMREWTQGRDRGEMKALVMALASAVFAPNTTRATARAVKEDAEVITELAKRHAATTEALTREIRENEGKFLAACARLRENEKMREQLRAQLREARAEVTKTELQREGGATSTTLYATSAIMGVILFYFHDINEVKHVDKKLAMWIPLMWIAALTSTAPGIQKFVTAANLVLSGYFLHVVLDHRRALGAVAHTIIG